jgi:hypothetical protein
MKPVPQPILLKLDQITAAPNVVINSDLLHMNTRNELIKNICYPNILMQTDEIKFVAELKSTLVYEKELKFRMMVWSILGKESDIGSNDDIFWFWSKRMTPPALFYAKHEDLHKTRLKTPFHPSWMKDLVGINPVDSTDASIFAQGSYLVVAKFQLSVMGEPIVRMYLIDPARMAYVGHYIFKTSGELVVSAEILDFHEVNGYFLPKTIDITLTEENLKTKWIMDRPVLNTQINPLNWQHDTYKTTIDLNGYAPKPTFYQVF